jgi:hypothetical protein
MSRYIGIYPPPKYPHMTLTCAASTSPLPPPHTHSLTPTRAPDDDGQNTSLDRHSLSYCVSLIENGVNPEALAVRERVVAGGMM